MSTKAPVLKLKMPATPEGKADGYRQLESQGYTVISCNRVRMVTEEEPDFYEITGKDMSMQLGAGIELIG